MSVKSSSETKMGGLFPRLMDLRSTGGRFISFDRAGAAKRLIRRADRHRDAREWLLAQKYYREALAIQSNLGHIWVQYGHALKEAGQIAEAHAAYASALDINPTVADWHLQIGHALKLQGRMRQAGQAYATAFRLDPQSQSAREELRSLGIEPGSVRDASKSADDNDIVWPRTWPIACSGSADASDDSSLATLTDLLSRHALLPRFLDLFDPEFYAFKNDIATADAATLPLRCIAHFCQSGLADLAAINDRHWFDAGFYRETYNISFQMEPADVYRHWLNQGITEGWAPNERVWLQDVQSIDLFDFPDNIVDYHRMSVAGLADRKRHTVIEHFAEGGILEGRAPLRVTDDNVHVFETIAKRATVRGRRDLALQILERVAAALPDRVVSLAQYADRLVDDRQAFAAAAIYRQVIAAGEATRWTYSLLSLCYAIQGRHRETYLTIDDGVAAFLQYPQLRYEKAQRLDEYFHATVREYETLAATGNISLGQDLVAQFCRDVTARPVVDALSYRPVTAVALFALLDLPQCRFYRVDQKIEQLEMAGFQVTLFDSNADAAKFLASITAFQAVIFYRVAPLPSIIPVIEAATSLGLITFYEIDDLLFLPKEYPGTYESYAGQISKETFSMLAMGVPLFASAMAMCDYGLASTPTLAREMAKIVRKGKAFTHRNGMGSDHERHLDYVLPRRQSDIVTLFYGSGTRAHKQDFQDLIEPALVEVARRHGKRIRIVLVGWFPISDALQKTGVLTVIEPIFDLQQYWELLKASDINIAVLKPSMNVDAKSEIKWMEAAMFGIPSVVSRTATYEEVIEEGRTGFLCDSVNDWVSALDRLVKDGALRRSVGLAAQTVVRKTYTIKAMAANIRSIMTEVSPAAPTTRRLKVLVVNVFYTPQTYGGATRVMHDNILHLSSRHGDRLEIEVFTAVDEAREDYVVESYVQDGIRVTGVTRSVEGETTAELSDAKMGAIFRSHLETSKPDIIHFHCVQRLSVAVVDAARDLAIPYVITAHDAWWVSDYQFLIDDAGQEHVYDFRDPMQVLARYGQKSFARMQTLRPALFGAAHVLGVSEPFSSIYQACGVPNVRTLANGVSDLPPHPRAVADQTRVVLGHVGGMVRHKGYGLLKHALSSYPFQHLRLVVVDHSRPKEHRHEEVWGTTPVTFIGKVKQSEVGELYCSMDVLMAPSLWRESFGLATREAQHYGCWVVASDRGAIGGDVSEGKNGHIVDVSELAGLVSALKQIDQHWTRYKTPPAFQPTLRTASDQSEDLAALYLSFGKLEDEVEAVDDALVQ